MSTAHVNGVAICYELSGEGHPLVLIQAVLDFLRDIDVGA